MWCQFWHLSLSADLANDPCFVSDVPLSALQSTHSFRCVYIFPAAVALPASTLGSGGRAVWAGCEDKEGVFAYACLATQTAAYTILSLKSSSSSLCTWNLAWMLQESSTFPPTLGPHLPCSLFSWARTWLLVDGERCWSLCLELTLSQIKRLTSPLRHLAKNTARIKELQM